jgi:chromosome partitioning protein
VGRIIAVANQKGGVGKTTTTVNLSASLVATKRKVLVIDLDPQGNATMGSGVNKHELEKSVYDVLVHSATAAEVTIKTDPAGYDILPANGDLTAAEVELIDVDGRERRLKTALDAVKDQYDYIVIDCPPSLNMLTVNAFIAADGIIIPMQCEYYALEGLTALMDTMERIKEINPGLQIDGLLRTMYDPRSSLTTDVSSQLINHFGDKVYGTVIPRNIRLAEAPSYGVPILHYEKNSRGAVAYLALAGEVNRKNKAAKAA